MAKKKYFYDKSAYNRRYYQEHKEELLERIRAYRQAVRNGTHVPQQGERLYQTREELMKASEEGDGEIDWDVWNRLVSEFHEKYLNDQYLNRPKGKKGRVLKLRYCYNPQGQLVLSGSSMAVSEKLKEFGLFISNDNVVICCNNERFRGGFFFSNTNYNGHQLLDLKNRIKKARGRR